MIELTKSRGISGLPVIGADGLAGLVTKRDLRFESNLDQPVSSIMTKRESLVTIGEGAEKDEVLELLHRHRIERLLVLDDSGELSGMITVRDIMNSSVHPLACKDEQERLRVGAAVGTGAETEDRVRALIDAEVDVIVVDTAHGHSRGVIDRWQYRDCRDCTGSGCSRCRCRQGRYRSGLNLYHPRRRRRWRATDYRHQ